MLVKFHSSTAGEIVMFAESARTMLRVLGKECSRRGVITLEQLPGEIGRLRAAIEGHRPLAKAAGTARDEPDDARPIGFVQRATPFIEFLERTLKNEGYVLWEAPADFGTD